MTLHFRSADAIRLLFGHPRPKRGRRECRVLQPTPTASRANGKSTRAVVATDESRITGIPCAMVLTVSFVLSPETWLCCLRRRRDAEHRRQLDPCLGVSGPHDFAVRGQHRSSVDMPRPSLPAPYTRDDREAP